MKQAFVASVIVAFCGLAEAAPGADCLNTLRSSKEFETLGNRLTFGAKPTLAQMADSSKATAEQRPAIDAVASEYEHCLELTGKDLGTHLPGSASVFVALGTELRPAFLALYKGETTFGQFNTRYNELRSETDRKLAELRERPGGKPSDSPPSGPRNTMQQDLYQCEQEAARSYPPSMVQVMTSPGFQAPPGPTQSNCTVYGNQMNCQSGQTGAGAAIYTRPPTYVTQDANLANRNGSVRSCMVAKGYSPK